PSQFAIGLSEVADEAQSGNRGIVSAPGRCNEQHLQALNECCIIRNSKRRGLPNDGHTIWAQLQSRSGECTSESARLSKRTTFLPEIIRQEPFVFVSRDLQRKGATAKSH